MPIERAVLFYTVDGSRPDRSSQAVAMERARVSWDPHAGYITHWLARIPGQPAGMPVRYRIAGWLAHPGSPATAEPEVWAQDGQGFAFHFSGERAFTTFAYIVAGSSSRLCPSGQARRSSIRFSWIASAAMLTTATSRRRANHRPCMAAR
ncbi:MAG: hypothetical protein IRZ31_10885 [Thermogemmatispora sp.]|uniref:hypothetical protein n=1 Tax=Thermogemmatispora sp. TaxID=1968838 RepID=UPI00261EA723|nr:hypothetical protein [Thermogemmatispora sp.]MBX5457395.1 hypothetical protein [Thermogemmatispora sp.]